MDNLMINKVDGVTVQETACIDKHLVWLECNKNNWYTLGTCEEYDTMLNMCNRDYSLDLLYAVASDICKHSERETVTNIMCLLSKHCVERFYEMFETGHGFRHYDESIPVC